MTPTLHAQIIIEKHSHNTRLSSALLQSYHLPDKQSMYNRPAQPTYAFSTIVCLTQLALLVSFALCTRYKDNVQASPDAGGMDFYYPMFQDVHVMIFVGFGFLMTFLHNHSFNAVGLTLFIGALIIQLAILTNGFWHNVHTGQWHRIDLDITTLIKADFACGTVLITFGALLGKVSPTQLLMIGIVECGLFSMNEYIGALHFGAVDMGGSIFVHTFGAYFGLAVSKVLGPPTTDTAESSDEHEVNGEQPESTPTTDTFAMLGTVFLWMFWSSFNGALASGSQQHRVVINTVLALTGSCVMAFGTSALMRNKRGKFSMVDIQNATLAGGVAVGSSSDLVIEPWGALLIGCCAGLLSVVGYVHVSPWLEDRFRIHDTCGVHNLHGMPGLMGATAGAISAAIAGESAYGEAIGTIFPGRNSVCEFDTCGWSASKQAVHQLYALVITLGVAVVGGCVTGHYVKPMRQAPTRMLSDVEYWVVDGASD